MFFSIHGNVNPDNKVLFEWASRFDKLTYE